MTCHTWRKFLWRNGKVTIWKLFTNHNWRAGCKTALCRILGRFSIFLRFVRSSACELQFDWKTLSSFFFGRFVFRIREITYAKNCVFHCVHKEIDNAFSPGDNYSFHESDLQITLRLLSSSSGNTVLLHTLFLEYETQIGQKKTGQCFSIELQFTCRTSDKSEKNRKTA